MLTLQKVKVEGLLSFHSYFHFQEIYNLLQSEDAYLFYDFGRECLVNTSPGDNTVPRAKIHLFGTSSLDGSHNLNTGALRLLQNPALCLEETMPVDLHYTPSVFTEWKGYLPGFEQLVVLNDYNTFCIHILSLFQDTHAKLKLIKPSWEQMRKSVKQALDDVTEMGKRRFPPEAATELYLYFLLHALAGVDPDKKQSIGVLKADLDRLCPISEGAQFSESRFILSCDAKGNSICPLAYYLNGKNSTQPLSVVEFVNPYKHPVTLVVKDTILTRAIPPKKSVFALRKEGKLVCFLPRFRMEGKIATYVWEGNLYNECGGIREQVDTIHTEPVSWARSSEYGTFIVDRLGKLDESAAWPESIPEKTIVMVDACALDYCMLYDDGTVDSRIKKHNWKDLISVSLGLNSAAAIDQTRNALLSDGTKIHGIQSAEVRTHHGHYICMDAKGNIQTDTGLSLADAVYGISIGKDGFAVACQNSIKLFDFENNCRKTWNISGASEIEIDGGLLAYYDAKTGEVIFPDF